VNGARALYQYCAERGVATAKCGKLIVATTDDEIEKLHALEANGRANGLDNLAVMPASIARELEPHLSCVSALHSPGTGIIDSHGLMLALQGELQDHGGVIAFKCKVTSMERRRSGWLVEIASGREDAQTLTVDAVVNAAGLGAHDIARATRGFPPNAIPPRVLAKGSYFAFRGEPVFRHLIYPAPVDGGLGIHVTLDLAGRMRFGPDVDWVKSEEYHVDPAKAAVYETAIRRYFPGLPIDSLVADYAGIRPKLSGPGETAADFVISTPAHHRLPLSVHLFGLESPGLTACLSLAEAVAERL
jgi:L-2-hydroxyglutarate oxidase LhgO